MIDAGRWGEYDAWKKQSGHKRYKAAGRGITRAVEAWLRPFPGSISRSCLLRRSFVYCWVFCPLPLSVKAPSFLLFKRQVKGVLSADFMEDVAETSTFVHRNNRLSGPRLLLRKRTLFQLGFGKFSICLGYSVNAYREGNLSSMSALKCISQQMTAHFFAVVQVDS